MHPASSALRRTPLYDEHVKDGARLVPFAGWEMPVQYTGVTQEHNAVRTAAGVFDVSHMGEIVMHGEYAGQVVNYLVTNDTSRLVDGQALYTCACNERGTILDDLIVYRVDSRRYLIVCNASNREKIAAHFKAAALNHCDFEDVSDATALIAVQGPKALDILARSGGDGPALGELKSFHFRDAVIANVRCTVARTGYTGEDGVEIFCAPGDAAQLWRVLVDLGRDDGLLPAGLGARDTLRLEARLSLYGNDIDETTNPIEAGLGWVVKLDKGDFIGREALERVKAQWATPVPGAGVFQPGRARPLTPSIGTGFGSEEALRKLVGFEMVGRGIARHGYPILDPNGAKIGVCTSGSPGPSVAKNIGLGYVPRCLSEIGTKLLIDCRGRMIEAVVAKTPFYKRS